MALNKNADRRRSAFRFQLFTKLKDIGYSLSLLIAVSCLVIASVIYPDHRLRCLTGVRSAIRRCERAIFADEVECEAG